MGGVHAEATAEGLQSLIYSCFTATCVSLGAKRQAVAAYALAGRLFVFSQTWPLLRPQLDFLLGQTQKYSTMLAERLKGEGPTAIAAATATEGPSSSWQPSASQELNAGPSAEANQSGVRQRPRRAACRASPAPPSSAAVSGTAGGLRYCSLCNTAAVQQATAVPHQLTYSHLGRGCPPYLSSSHTHGPCRWRGLGRVPQRRR